MSSTDDTFITEARYLMLHFNYLKRELFQKCAEQIWVALLHGVIAMGGHSLEKFKIDGYCPAKETLPPLMTYFYLYSIVLQRRKPSGRKGFPNKDG